MFSFSGSSTTLNTNYFSFVELCIYFDIVFITYSNGLVSRCFYRPHSYQNYVGYFDTSFQVIDLSVEEQLHDEVEVDYDRFVVLL